MRFDLLDSYESAIKAISARLVHRGRLDHNSYDVDDYQSRLRMVSWDAQLTFRKRGVFCVTRERRYVNKVLSNAAVDFARRRCREEAGLRKLSDVVIDHSYCEESRIEARECLRTLRDALGDDFSVLCRVAAADGRVSEAYAFQDGNYETFRSRVRRIRRRAKKILEKRFQI